MQIVDKYIFSIEIFVSNNLSTHAFIYFWNWNWSSIGLPKMLQPILQVMQHSPT